MDERRGEGKGNWWWEGKIEWRVGEREREVEAWKGQKRERLDWTEKKKQREERE